ncbi:MAG: sulfatase, partial [Planctomycetota bacterium]
LAPASLRATVPYDVLMVVVDDLNDGIELFDPRSEIETPNLIRLAKRGVFFRRAYCISPACNPSRTATLTGLRPSRTGIYGNRSDWRRALPKRSTILQRFRKAGYNVRGAGKIFHHKPRGVFHDKESFEDFLPTRPQLYPPKKLNRSPEYGSRNTDWGVWPPRVEDSIDFQTTAYCVKALGEKGDARPRFLACGIYKPHSPFFAPKGFQRAKSVALPARKVDDWGDLPKGAKSLLRRTKWFWEGMTKVDRKLPGSYQRFIDSYAACVRFADHQIGLVLDALDKSPRRERTIVVLWSDHGFHLGEKDHIEKFALWEKSTHVPFIVVVPGLAVKGKVCDRPVDLTTIYPTLLDLCGLRPADLVDGQSLRPLLYNPGAKWDRPALTTYLKGNHAVRSERWRYIRYADGTEELYDHERDPHEWTNLAQNGQFESVRASLRKWLPTRNADQVPDWGKR